MVVEDRQHGEIIKPEAVSELSKQDVISPSSIPSYSVIRVLEF